MQQDATLPSVVVVHCTVYGLVIVMTALHSLSSCDLMSGGIPSVFCLVLQFGSGSHSQMTHGELQDSMAKLTAGIQADQQSTLKFK